MAFGSWRKAKVNVEEQVTFRSWNLLVRAGGAFCCVGGEVPLSWSPWFSSLLKLGAGDVYALRIFLPPLIMLVMSKPLTVSLTPTGRSSWPVCHPACYSCSLLPPHPTLFLGFFLFFAFISTVDFNGVPGTAGGKILYLQSTRGGEK